MDRLCPDAGDERFDNPGGSEVDRPSGKSVPLLALDPDFVDDHFALSSDEQWIYFSVATNEADVWLAELR